METDNRQSFDRSVVEIIKARSSIRTYKNVPLSDDIKQKLNTYFLQVKGPFDAGYRFKLIDIIDQGTQDSSVKLGTYGIIRGATSFIAAAVDLSAKNLEQFGFVFEKVVLYATSLGLGTCWLGGTFRKGDFAKAMELQKGELLPVISPIGYPKEDRSLIDSTMRFFAGSKNRKDWRELFFNGNFKTSLTESDAGKYSIPLEMLRLSPSASNKQPWRIIKERDNFHFYLSHAKRYWSALGFDIQRIDMGIAMSHFQLVMEEMGLKGSWEVKCPEIGTIPDNLEYIVSWMMK